MNFGDQGIKAVALSASLRVYTAIIQPDDKIIVLGYIEGGTNDLGNPRSDGLIARFLPDGNLDTSFAGTGYLISNFGSRGTYFRGISILSDGSLLVTGSAQEPYYVRRVLAKFSSIGVLDSSFAVNGVNYSDQHRVGNGVAVQSSGKIIVSAASTNPTFDYGLSTKRFQSFGNPDTSFGPEGGCLSVGTPFNMHALLMLPDDKFLIGGTSSTGSDSLHTVIRCGADGMVDTTFGTSGMIRTQVGAGGSAVEEIQRLADGRFVAIGHDFSWPNYEYSAARYSANGLIDTIFGNYGTFRLSLGTTGGEAYSGKLQLDGKLVIAGTAFNSSNYGFGIVRVTDTGQVDTTFSSGLSTLVLGTFSEGRAVVIQSDGKIVVIGHAKIADTWSIALVRFWP